MCHTIEPNSENLNKKITETRLSLIVKPHLISGFSSMFQRGFIIRTHVGISILEMLCQNIGIRSAYVNDRIKTVFMDGRPVDDIDTTIVKDGSTLAFSAAMPGLVGATFRRGGNLASFRSTITYQKDTSEILHRQGVVCMKLFNLLVKELGPPLLQRGILVKGRALSDVINFRFDDFQSGCVTVRLNHEEVTFDTVMKADLCQDENLLFLRVDKVADLEKNNLVTS